MRFMSKAPDGGKHSGVTGYFLFEHKKLCSVVLLRFNKGSREAFHEHAFNAVTWWLYGSVVERHLDGRVLKFRTMQLKYTPRNTFHKIEAERNTWAVSVRGPWIDRWRESRLGRLVTLTHGRREVQ